MKILKLFINFWKDIWNVIKSMKGWRGVYMKLLLPILLILNIFDYIITLVNRNNFEEANPLTKPIIDNTLASLVKYMSNSFLLMKQTFCNEFYQITKGYGESYNELRELFLLDKQFSGMRTNVDESTMNMDHHCHSKDVPAIANEENNDLLKFISSYHQVSKK